MLIHEKKRKKLKFEHHEVAHDLNLCQTDIDYQMSTTSYALNWNLPTKLLSVVDNVRVTLQKSIDGGRGGQTTIEWRPKAGQTSLLALFYSSFLVLSYLHFKLRGRTTRKKLSRTWRTRLFLRSSIWKRASSTEAAWSSVKVTLLLLFAITHRLPDPTLWTCKQH